MGLVQHAVPETASPGGECPRAAGSPHLAAKKRYLPALTGLRFFLALWVILNHLMDTGTELDAWSFRLPHPVYVILHSSYLAVGIFFVLSGFVLARGYGSMVWNRGSFLRYGAGRIARIYPGYALSLLIVAPFIIEDRLPGKAGLVARYGLLLQGWAGTPPVHWNTPAWSLSCEIFFYLCFPLGAVCLSKISWRKALAIGAAVCFLPAVLLRLGVPDAWKPIIHLADFIMGILTARAYDLLLRSRPPLAGRGHWLYVPAMLLSAFFILNPEMIRGPIDLNGALRPLNALLLIGLSLEGGLLARWLSSRIAVFLGQTSYSMYILHVPLLWWYRRLAAEPTPAVYVPAVVIISAAVFQVLERPANRRIRKWCDSRI